MKTELFYHPLQLPTLDSGLGGWAVWGGEGQGPVTTWLGQCLGCTLQVPSGLARGTAPSAARRGQAWAWGWLEAQLPAHRGLAATPQASLSRGQAGRVSLGCPGPGQVFRILLEKHSTATQPGSFSALTPPWLSALGGRGGHCQTCLVPRHYLCGLGQLTYPLGAPDPSGRRG